MKRNALSLWFAGLAVLGLLRTWAAVSRHGVDTMAALWLAGSAAMAAIALLAWRRRPRD